MDPPPTPSPSQRCAANPEASGAGLATTNDGSPTVDATTATAAYACACLQTLTRRLGRLRGQVLADTDPEPLHHLRVDLRRLRSLLTLFGPALRLPEGVSEARLAWVARRTSRTRDLDVLASLLRSELAPALPDQERHQLSRVLRRLEKEREPAFLTLAQALESRRYRQSMARLGHWLREPRATALGSLPLRPWASEWLGPICAGLFLEEGWFCDTPQDERLHGLRKRLKVVRYAIDSLQPLLDPELLDWLTILKAAQDHLGELHDLRVLAQAFPGEGKAGWSRQPLPALRDALADRERRRWRQWLDLRDAHTTAPRRRAFSAAVARLGDG